MWPHSFDLRCSGIPFESYEGMTQLQFQESNAPFLKHGGQDGQWGHATCAPPSNSVHPRILFVSLFIPFLGDVW